LSLLAALLHQHTLPPQQLMLMLMLVLVLVLGLVFVLGLGLGLGLGLVVLELFGMRLATAFMQSRIVMLRMMGFTHLMVLCKWNR
jgi:hypothetical protein